jgi:hypothetical protein
MVDDAETVVVSGLFCNGALGLQVESGPRRLASNIYSVEKIERLICNGQQVKPGRAGADLYTAELRLPGVAKRNGDQ